MTQQLPWAPGVMHGDTHLSVTKAARETARIIIERIDSQGWKGKKRDTMAFELWMGALCHVKALFAPADDRPIPLWDHMSQCGHLLVSPLGYRGLQNIAKRE